VTRLPARGAAAAALQEIEDGPRKAVRLAACLAARARGLDDLWDPCLHGTELAAAEAAIAVLAPPDPACWGAAELGALYEAAVSKETRNRQGTWFTPGPVAEWMIREAVPAGRCDCGNPQCGLQVMVLDPACGAGIFLVAAARRVARVYAALMTGSADPPPAAVRFALPVAMEECVFGVDADPGAVDAARAACWLEAGGTRPATWMDDNIITGDTLAGDLPKPLASRLDGPQPLIIAGNPPYRDNAKGAAPWIEARRRPGETAPRPSLDEFRLPGNGRVEGKLSSLYVYFWRWALWQALETRAAPGTVALITPKSYLDGAGYAGMQAHLRRVASEGWIVDLSPEGHQAKVSTRIFPGVQQPVCIGIYTNAASGGDDGRAGSTAGAAREGRGTS
jgi:hypothetical protein